MSSASDTTPGTEVPPRPPLVDAAERQAILAARMESVSLLAGGVAHDLNNILTAVLGFGTLLAEQVASDPEAADNAREVLVAGERAAALTRQLLALSRRQVLTPRLASVGTIVDDARVRIEETIGSSVTLDIRAGADLPLVAIDVDRLQDALVVLAANARDAMPTGGRLLVETTAATVDVADAARHIGSETGEYVRVSVSDTGCGIPGEIQDRIFEPFFTTKVGGQGSGLGLSTVYGFVKQSGGHIRVYSQPELGTTFRIYLPVPGSTKPAVPTPPTPHPAPGAGQTVLVVDDIDAVRALAADALRRAGYRVIVAASASDALYMAAGHRGPIHLLLTDVIMPGSSGVDLATELLAERRGLRVLFMSGFSDSLVVRNGLMGAGDAFLQKPFGRELLLQKVAGLLR